MTCACFECMPRRRSTRSAPVVQRFMAFVHIEPSGCWRWVGQQQNGYGRFNAERSRTEQAHRVAYRLFVGPIPDGHEIDHLCRTTLCVSPQHLEAVTAAENSRRSDSVSGLNARKVTCLRGHPFTPENTYPWRDARGRAQRMCRACRRASRRLRTVRDRMARQEAAA